jgi:hypothetical protein
MRLRRKAEFNLFAFALGRLELESNLNMML